MGCLRKQLTCWAFVEALCGLSALGFEPGYLAYRKEDSMGSHFFL